MITALLGRRPRAARRSIENPSTPLSDPDDWLFDALAGIPTSSGVRVNDKTALAYPAVWRAVNLISGVVAKLPLFVYRRTTGDGLERDIAHPSYRLLRYRPNRLMSWFSFRYALQAQVLLRGNGYALIERAGVVPDALWPLDASRMRIEMSQGELIYIYSSSVTGSEQVFRHADILHVRGLASGGRLGIGVIENARESLGLGMAALRYGARFFRNSGRGGLVFTHPASLSDAAQARLSQNIRAHQGLENSHLPWIVEEGAKLDALDISNEDAQFLETRQHELIEIANWFGLPPHKLGHPARTSFASLEQENQAFLDDGIDPWLVAWEAECRDKLLSEEEKDSDSRVVEFLRQALLRANMQDRGQFYNSALLGGWMNRDEIRRRENMNPIPGGEGAKFFTPLNVTAGGTPPPAMPASAPASGVSGVRRRALEDLFGRMARRATVQARKRSGDGSRYVSWCGDEMESQNRRTFLDAAEPILELAGYGPAGPVADEWFGRLREALLAAAEVRPAELERSVDQVCGHIDSELPALMAAWLGEVESDEN